MSCPLSSSKYIRAPDVEVERPLADRLDVVVRPPLLVATFVAASLSWPEKRFLSWSDDPRLFGLADAQRWLANRHGRLEGKAPAVPDPPIAQLVARSAGASSPAWDRLTEIARQLKAGG